MKVLVSTMGSNCNANCDYCIRKDSPSLVMSYQTVDSIVYKIKSNEYEFVCGEPMLAPINLYRYFFKKINDSVIFFHTNGLIMNKYWLDLFKQYNVIVYLKIDDYANVSKKVINSLNKLKENDINVFVETTITNKIVDNPTEMYRFYTSNNIDNIKLNIAENVEPLKIAYFLKTMAYFWQFEYQNGHYTHINLVDEAKNVLLGGPSLICGSTGCCQKNIVVDSNGNCFNCIYDLDHKYCLGNINTDSYETIINNNVFINHDIKVSKLCYDCRFKKACYGGCFNKHDIYCNDQYCAKNDFYSMMVDIIRVLY